MLKSASADSNYKRSSKHAHTFTNTQYLFVSMFLLHTPVPSSNLSNSIHSIHNICLNLPLTLGVSFSAWHSPHHRSASFSYSWALQRVRIPITGREGSLRHHPPAPVRLFSPDRIIEGKWTSKSLHVLKYLLDDFIEFYPYTSSSRLRESGDFCCNFYLIKPPLPSST